MELVDAGKRTKERRKWGEGLESGRETGKIKMKEDRMDNKGKKKNLFLRAICSFLPKTSKGTNNATEFKTELGMFTKDICDFRSGILVCGQLGLRTFSPPSYMRQE